MQRVLLTAFGPYGPWEENASWLALRALLRDPPMGIELTTRLYPVDFAEARARMVSDMATPFDLALHLGQAPGAPGVVLETFAQNTKQEPDETAEMFLPLEPEGPAAYRSELPLAALAAQVRSEGIPASVSLHAGTYLCNATLYWSHHFAQTWEQPARATFVHLPLDLSQVVRSGRNLPSMPAEISAHAIRVMLESLYRAAPSATTEAKGGIA